VSTQWRAQRRGRTRRCQEMRRIGGDRQRPGNNRRIVMAGPLGRTSWGRPVGAGLVPAQRRTRRRARTSLGLVNQGPQQGAHGLLWMFASAVIRRGHLAFFSLLFQQFKQLARRKDAVPGIEIG